MVQFGGLWSKLLGPLIESGFVLIGNVLKPLAKSDLRTIGSTAATSALNTSIEKTIFG